jgi:gliding motility-associated-like protein
VTITPGAPSGVYRFRLAVTESGNMNSMQCRIYSQPFTITILPNPVTTATNNGPVCEGSKAIMTASGGSQYAWSGPNAFTGSGSPLALDNIQQSQAGKYYVTVTSAAGCSSMDSTTVIVNPSPTATAGGNTSICSGDSVQLSSGGGQSYQWLPATGLSDAGISDPKASPAITTEYMIVVSNQFSCKDSAYVVVNILQEPVANAGPDRTILEGQSIKLSGSITGDGNYSWSPPFYIDDINSLQPVVNPPADASYILNVVSSLGCGASSDTMFVKVYKNIFVPNAFTPNGDGFNDTWNIPALAAYPYFEVSVYGRWGGQIFHTRNIAKGWDGKFKGKTLPAGAYIYIINTGTMQDVIKGSVMIVR